MPTYDNAWLRARESARSAAPEGTRWDPQVRGYVRDIPFAADEMPDVPGDPVAEARRFLETSSQRLKPVSVQDVVAMERGIAEARARRERAEAAPGAVRPISLQDVTQGLSEAGRGAQLASILPSPASAPLAALGTVARVPEMLRKGFETPTEGVTIGEGAGEALGLLPAAGSVFSRIRRAARAAKMGSAEMAGSQVARPYGPSRYEQINYNPESPNFQRADVRPLNIPRPFRMAQNPAGAATEAENVTLGTLTPYSTRLAPGGQRMVPSERLATFAEDTTTYPVGYADLSTQLEGLSDLDRAARQARAQERFGRIYRSE